jgi:hypothetical protein
MKYSRKLRRRWRSPDFLFGTDVWWEQWAYEDRLANLEGALGPVLDLFDADIVEAATLLNGRTGRRGLYGLPMGRSCGLQLAETPPCA